MKLREATQQALEALEYYRSGEDYQPTPASEAITSLKAALAESQEPAIPWGHAIGAEPPRGCRVCGIGADGKAYGYVCPRLDCPTKVTCGGVV